MVIFNSYVSHYQRVYLDESQQLHVATSLEWWPRIWGEQQQHNNLSNLLFTAHNSIFHPYLSGTKRWYTVLDTVNVFKCNKTLLLLLLLSLPLSSSSLLFYFCRMIQTFFQRDAHHHPSDAPEVHGGVPGLRRSGRWRNHGSWARAGEGVARWGEVAFPFEGALETLVKHLSQAQRTTLFSKRRFC